jgi:hypothetical protein
MVIGMMKNTSLAVLFLLGVFGVGNAQVLSRFDYEDAAFDERVATTGPNAVSSGTLANARASGNGSPQGLAAGIVPQFSGACFTPGGCAQNVDMNVPNTGNFLNVPDPLVSTDYRHANTEAGGWFFFKDFLSFGLKFEKLTAQYSYDNGVGGCVPQIEFAAYPPGWTTPSPGAMPRDNVWRTYTFSYNPTSGVASISVNSPAHTEVSFGVAGMNFCGWSANPLTIASGLDNLKDPNTFMDNTRYGRLTVTPVLLEYFNGEQLDHQVQLDWKTATQSSHQSFLLYRSTDGSDWKEISRVYGESNTQSPTAYSYIDKTPYHGLNFYRIVQVDLSGATTGYPSVKVNVQYDDTGLLSLYPNPIQSGTLHMQFDAKVDGEPAVLQILALDGRLMGHQGFELKNGVNDLTYDVQGMAAGLYIAKVIYAGKSHSERFSVMK